MPQAKTPEMMRLFYHVMGRPGPSNSVYIDSTSTVDELKEQIVADITKGTSETNIPHRLLNLYQVEITNGKGLEAAARIKLAIPKAVALRNGDVIHLESEDVLGQCWTEPPQDVVHVLVELPNGSELSVLLMKYPFFNPNPSTIQFI